MDLDDLRIESNIVPMDDAPKEFIGGLNAARHMFEVCGEIFPHLVCEGLRGAPPGFGSLEVNFEKGRLEEVDSKTIAESKYQIIHLGPVIHDKAQLAKGIEWMFHRGGVKWCVQVFESFAVEVCGDIDEADLENMIPVSQHPDRHECVFALFEAIDQPKTYHARARILRDEEQPRLGSWQISRDDWRHPLRRMHFGESARKAILTQQRKDHSTN